MSIGHRARSKSRTGEGRDPFGGRDRIVDCGGKFVFGREAVVDRNEAAAGCMRQRRRDAVMRGNAAGNEPADVARLVDETFTKVLGCDASYAPRASTEDLG